MTPYLIAAGGLIGTFLFAWASFADRSLYPDWKRWTVGILGAVLTVTFWLAHPQLSNPPDDGSSLADQWP